MHKLESVCRYETHADLFSWERQANRVMASPWHFADCMHGNSAGPESVCLLHSKCCILNTRMVYRCLCQSNLQGISAVCTLCIGGDACLEKAHMKTVVGIISLYSNHAANNLLVLPGTSQVEHPNMGDRRHRLSYKSSPHHCQTCCKGRLCGIHTSH